MEMKSLGKKSGNPVAVESNNKVEMHYPSVTIMQDMLPALEKKKVDDKITLTIEVKITGINKYGDGDTEYRLDLLKAGVVGKEGD